MEYYWEQKATYWPRQLQRESGRGYSVCLQGLELKITFEICTPPLNHFSLFLPHSVSVWFYVVSMLFLSITFFSHIFSISIFIFSLYALSFLSHLSFCVSGNTPSPVILRLAGGHGVGQGWAMQKIRFDDREGSFCSLILLSALTHFKPKWSSKGAHPQWAHSSLWSHRQCKGIPTTNSPATQPMLNWKV